LNVAEEGLDMGFGTGDLRFLLSAKRMGLQAEAICTLGHQTLFLSQREVTLILKEYDNKHFSLPQGRPMYFADDVLRPLGFTKIDSMDASDYEGANVIHDLNRPIPLDMQEKYDLVWDGGTLEHIFNFPAALENAMRMVKVGGHISLNTPANNQCGHGFYQFSPELFFRVFVPENGFELLRIYMAVDGGRGGYYHVADPINVHGRVELLNCQGTLLLVHARKVAHVPDVLKTPQQSDYLVAWTDHQTEKQDDRLKSLMRARLSPTSIAKISKALNYLRQKRAVWRWKTQSKVSNRKLYVPVTRWDVPTRQAFNR
jgi:SAM-dependent methyltransferase